MLNNSISRIERGGRKFYISTFCVLIFCAITFVLIPSSSVMADEPTSETDERLKEKLKRRPEADANGDGILTFTEAKSHFQKARAQREKAQKGETEIKEEERKRRNRTMTEPSIAPTIKDVPYGPHERNVLDFWKAASEKPTPLVVHIHGGGFVGGDKRRVRGEEIEKCLDNGVSIASINYRLRKTTTLDNIMLDIARAIQFMRYKAKEWNIDKTKVATYGGSAGGGATLWLAVHDDLAHPESDDPVLRESTRLTVAGHLNSQATYDCEKWADIVGVAPSWMEEMGMIDDLDFYGIKDRSEVNSPKAIEIRKKVDMLAFMDKDDPPLFLHNVQDLADPKEKGRIIHHPRHAMYLKKKCDEIGIEAVLVTRETPKEEQVDMLDFFFKHFRKE